MKLKLTAVLVLSLSLLLAACGGGEAETSEAPAGASVSVVMHDIYYNDTPTNAEEPPVWNVGAGETVTISLDNQGALEHNWAIVKAGETVPEVFDAEANSDILYDQTGLVQPGTTFSDVFVAPTEAGEYTIICTVAGHYPSMQGRLVVAGE